VLANKRKVFGKAVCLNISTDVIMHRASVLHVSENSPLSFDSIQTDLNFINFVVNLGM